MLTAANAYKTHSVTEKGICEHTLNVNSLKLTDDIFKRNYLSWGGRQSLSTEKQRTIIPGR